MVYIFAFVGFVFGFAVGLGVINVMLRNRKINEVREDQSSKWIYGLTVWGTAFIGLWLGLTIYNNYFY
jgi:hypothetical protein